MRRKRHNNRDDSIFPEPQSLLFPINSDESAEQEPKALNLVKSIEAQYRAGAEVFAEKDIRPSFPPIILPPRWEALQAIARKKNVPLKALVMPVHDAIVTLEKEIRQIEETGIGKLFVVSGVTGSGKTTFLNSLNLFIGDIDVQSINSLSLDRRENIENALAAIRREVGKVSIVVLEGKEAPGALTSNEIDVLLTTLNADFRSDSGRRTLFVIPTTSQAVAQSISERAATIGGMTSREKPFYVFNGPPRNDFIRITNDTLRALNESRTLFDYGVTDELAKGLAESSDSIGSFIGNCYTEIVKKREALENSIVNIKRKRIHLWLVFCSLEEEPRRNHDIIRSLTVGDSQHVQVKRLLIGDSRETRFWEGRESAFAQAAQYLDLRIMYLPLRTINAIVTAYGYKELVDDLKRLHLDSGDRVLKREAVRVTAQKSLGSTAIGAFLKKEGFSGNDIAQRGKPDDKAKELFKEIIKISTKDDKALNALIAETLRDWNKDTENKVVTELSLNERGTLNTDIAVITPTDIYCLEMKWRSSLLHDSEVIRETAKRVKEYATELPELRNLLGNLR